MKEGDLLMKFCTCGMHLPHFEDGKQAITGSGHSSVCLRVSNHRGPHISRLYDPQTEEEYFFLFTIHWRKQRRYVNRNGKLFNLKKIDETRFRELLQEGRPAH